MNRQKPQLVDILLIICSFAVFITGCASSKEKASFQNAQQIENKFNESQGETDANPNELYSSPPQLETFLRHASLNNPGLKSAFYAWKSQLNQIPQARALMDPKFSYTYYISEVETRVGPQKQKLGITQAFPWFGTLSLKGGVSWEKAEQARLKYEAEKLALFFQVKEAWYDFYYLNRALSINKENFELLRQWETILLKKYAAGSAMHGQVIKIQVELGKLEDRIKTLDAKRTPVDTRLKSLLNITTPALFPAPAGSSVDSVPVAFESIWRKLKRNNPSLESLDRKITLNEKKIALARKKVFPGFMVGFNYIQTGDFESGGGMAPPAESGKDPMMLGASINIPIQFGRISSSVNEARAGKKSAEHARKNLENKFRTRLAGLIFKIEDARRKATLYKDLLVPKALQALQAFEISFRGGQATYLDLLDAQRVLLKFELIYEKSVVEHEKRLAELEMIVGEPLK